MQWLQTLDLRVGVLEGPHAAPDFFQSSGIEALFDQGRYLAILSNVDKDLLELSIGRLGVRPDLAITRAEADLVKPQERNRP